jgi:hypothetical protein
MTGTRSLIPFATLALSLSLHAGCRDDLTQVALVVQSDLQVPSEVEAIDVASVEGPFSPPVNPFFSGTGVPLPPFPLSVAFASGGKTTSFSVTVRLFRAVTSGTPVLVVSRTVTDIRFVFGQTMMLVLAMNRACACQGTSCPGPGDPACDNIERPTLEPFDPAVAPPSSMFGGNGTAGTGGTMRPPVPQGTDAF